MAKRDKQIPNEEEALKGVKPAVANENETEKNKADENENEAEKNKAEGNENEAEKNKADENENEAKKNKTDENENEKVSFKAKSNTGFPNYFRAGLRFTPAFKEYEASKEVYDSLKKDNHLTLSSEIE